MKLELRLAEQEELSCVASMYKDARAFEGCVWDEDYPNEKLLFEDFNAKSLYVFAQGNEIIGAISILKDEELNAFECWKIKTDNFAEFARVVVSKKRLGQGYGKKMVVEALRLLAQKGCDSVRILVAPTNRAAVEIYKKTGFDFLRLEKFPYGDFWLCERKIEKNGCDF